VRFVTANGASIPVLGFGTYGMARLYMLGMIPATLNAPHRHGTDRPHEAEVGECVAASGLKRQDVFLTTKVWVANYPARAFAASVDDSLRKLRTDCYCTGRTPPHRLPNRSRGSTLRYGPAKCATSASATSIER
jgi:diketogulonate reductase-like aldo/keto reductase